jgi:hypothetical protein
LTRVQEFVKKLVVVVGWLAITKITATTSIGSSASFSTHPKQNPKSLSLQALELLAIHSIGDNHQPARVKSALPTLADSSQIYRHDGLFFCAIFKKMVTWVDSLYFLW